MRLWHFLAILLLTAFWACKSDASSSANGKDAAGDTRIQAESTPAPVRKAIPAPPTLKTLGLKAKPGFTSDHADYQWMYKCVEAARSRDYPTLQNYIHAEKGVYFLHRPGVGTSIDRMSTAADLKKSNWHAFANEYSGKEFTEVTIFPTESFKVTPEWKEKKSPDLPPLMVDVKGSFTYFPDLVKALTEYGFMDPEPKEKKLMDEVDELVELELLVDWVYYYFGKVNGKWHLIGLDIARCDFSA